MNLRKLFTMLSMLCFMSASAADSLVVYSQINIYPYYFDSDKGNSGVLPEVLTNILGGKYDVSYYTLTCETCDDNFTPDIICCPADEPAPEGYTKYDLPLQINYVVCFRRGEPIESIFGLSDKKVIIVRNDYPFEALYRHRTSHILNVTSVEEALNILSDGYNDCAVLPLSAVMPVLAENRYKNIDFLPTPYIVKPLAFAVKKESKRLDSTVRVMLQNMLKDGEFETISERWLHDTSRVHYMIPRWILVFVIILILAVICLYLWIRTLYEEVDVSAREQINTMIHNPLSPLVMPSGNPLLEKIMSSSPFWFAISDSDGKIIRASRAFLHGVAHIDDLPNGGLKWSDIFDEATAEDIIQSDNLIFEGLANSVLKTFNYKSEYFNASCWTVKHPFKYDNRPDVFVITAVVSPVFSTSLFYHNMLPELFVQTVINTSPDIIYIKSEDGVYKVVNQAFCDYTQDTFENIVGKTDFELFSTKMAEQNLHSDKVVLKTGEVWSDQSWWTDTQCIEHKFETRKMPLATPDGRIFGIVGYAHDITDNEKFLRQIKSLNDKLHESDRLKSSFMANLGHDIRIPIKTIIEYSDLLADSDLTYDQRIEIIEMIQANGNQLTDLVNDMVDYSKVEAGYVQIKYSDFSLNSVVADVYNLANNKKMQFNKDNMIISLLIDTIEDDIIVHSDSFRLKQILKNMLTTFIKFADTDCIYFGYRTASDKVFFFVNTDTGDITHEELEAYANEHDGSDVSLSQIEESYGISIIIAQRLIAMMGGKMWVENINSGHPSFIFYIPYEQRDENMSSIIYDSKNNIHEIPDWSGHTILIAEDEELNFILLQGLMMRTKIKVIRAKNGIEAVQQYKDNPEIDVVLMDVRMPKMNGLDASEQILEYDRNADIIAQTAYAIPEVDERCKKIGIHRLLEKPIDQGELLAECNKYMQHKHTANDNELMD